MDGRLRKLVEASEAIVFFGGAGVSCESGIPDFRSTDGLYHQEYRWPPEEILSHDFFERRPEEFFRFYRDKMLYPQAEPNAAHLALARLEQAGKLKAVVTQNIDGLHQAAGSKNVLELHGSVYRNHCTRCGAFYTLDDVLRSEGVPRCGCGGVIKPDVVPCGPAAGRRYVAERLPRGGPAALFYRRRAGGRQQDADPGRRPGRPGDPGLYRPRTGRL